MAHSDHFLPLFDESGNLYAVMLSADLWGRGRHRLEPYIRTLLKDLEPEDRPEPLHEWKEFQSFWDFKYPLTADVQCGNCGAFSEDWEHDPQKNFRLKSAQLGGLVVFHCKACGATVRKKHFKDHYCFEFTPNARGGKNSALPGKP